MPHIHQSKYKLVIIKCWPAYDFQFNQLSICDAILKYNINQSDNELHESGMRFDGILYVVIL